MNVYAGEDRYDTAGKMVASVAEWECAHGMLLDGVGIATGVSFPDSLGSSYLLSLTHSVLLLASKNDAENVDLYDLLEANGSTITFVSVFGGENSVSSATRAIIQDAIGGNWLIIDK